MFDTDGRNGAATTKPSPIEFLRVEFSPAKDGSIFVAIRATCIDEPEEECFELIEEELASDQVPTLESALELVSEHARRSFTTT